MNYTHINTNNHIKIETLHSLGLSAKEIGKRLKCNRSSIYRELKRLGKGKEYNAEKAQDDYETKRSNSKPKGKFTKEFGG